MKPFRYWIIDDAVKTVPAAAVPAADWPGWEARYAGEMERGKRTARKGLPGAVQGAIDGLRSPHWVGHWFDALGYAVLPDPTDWGGGLQATAAGGSLAVHLDFDRHKKLPGWRRALSLIAFIHERWESSWGGALCLCDPNGDVIERIIPLPGRLVAFENSDLSYHGVEPITGPAERVSVMVNFLAPATPANVRTRALFLPPR